MRYPKAAQRARDGNEFARRAKQLRDETADPNEIAASLARLVARLAPGAVARTLVALHRIEWLEVILTQDAAAIADLASRVSSGRVATHAGRHRVGADKQSVPVLSGEVEISTDELWASGARSTTRPVRTRSPRMLEGPEVLLVHEALVSDFATSDDPIFPPGIKHGDLLESAVSRQYTSLGGEPKYKRFAEMAASLFYGLALNHAFHNGNKRTALVALLVLADKNDMVVVASEEDLYAFVLDVVNHRFRPTSAGSATEATDREVSAIAAWLQPRIRKTQHRSRMVKGHELKSLLRDAGCDVEQAARSQIKLTRAGLRSVVDWDGDTREVGPAIIRKIRKDLKLSEADGIEDEVFYGYVPPLDRFIQKYKGLLRSLAHV